jgi:hypothetical protein
MTQVAITKTAVKPKRSALQVKKTKSSGYSKPSVECQRFLSDSIIIKGAFVEDQFRRVDIEFFAVDHSQSSFEARIFFNNQKATSATALTLKNGYVGSFYIFGHGGCFGDVGHCEINAEPRDTDPRPSHPLQPIKKSVILPQEAWSKYLIGKETVTITVVPLLMGTTEQCNDSANPLHFKSLKLTSYN